MLRHRSCKFLPALVPTFTDALAPVSAAKAGDPEVRAIRESYQCDGENFDLYTKHIETLAPLLPDAFFDGGLREPAPEATGYGFDKAKYKAVYASLGRALHLLEKGEQEGTPKEASLDQVKKIFDDIRSEYPSQQEAEATKNNRGLRAVPVLAAA